MEWAIDNMNSSFSKYEEMILDGKIRSLGTWGYFSTAIYLTLIGITATIGNSLVVILILTDKRLKKSPHNLLLLNMAASDLGISILGYPLTTASNYAGRYLFSDYVCVIQGFWCFTFAQASLNTLIPISIYRYIVVCKPHLSYHLTRRATALVILLVWIYTLAWTAPPLFGWSSYTYEPFGTSCSLDWGSPKPLDVAYIYILFFSCYLIHIAVISYCYYYVYTKSINLKLHPVRTPISYEHAVEYKNYRAESKITTMCLVMVIVLIIVWAPYTFVCLALVYKPDIPVWWTTLPTMFAKLASMLNPIIYAATNANFRATFTAVFKRSNIVQPKIMVRPTDQYTAEERRTNVSDIFMVDRTRDGVYIGLSAVNIGTGQSSSCPASPKIRRY